MVSSIPADRYGVDSLLDPVYDTVDQAPYRVQRIDASYEGNPQKLSFDTYGTNKYWHYILLANGLAHPSELKSGMQVILPVASVNTEKSVKKVETSL